MMLMPRNHSFDMFDDFFKDDLFPKKVNSFMKTDIKEKSDKYIIEMDLPGYEKGDISIELKDGYLVISASTLKESGNDDDAKYIHKERFYGECSRSFYVGDNISEEDIDATFKNGILVIDVPKKEAKEEPTKKIEIK